MPGNPAVAARMRKIAARMTQRGLRVSVMPGWETRGRSATFTPRAVVYHHTAAAVDVDRLLRDGRADLAGPLCNFALHRDGGWVLVAAGRANHAGSGILPSGESYGVEATGPNKVGATGPAAFDNYPAYVLGTACIFEVEGWNPHQGYGHKETARPPGRKVDPAFDIGRFETAVRAAMNGAAPQQEDNELTEEQARQLKFVYDQLRGAVGAGQTSFAGTVEAILRTVQTLINEGRSQTGALANGITDSRSAVLGALAALPPPAVDVDEQAVAAQVKQLLDSEGVQVDLDALLDALRKHPLAPVA